MEAYTNGDDLSLDDLGNGSFGDSYYYNGEYYNFEEWWTYSTTEDEAADGINLYLPPILLVTGTVGNILSCVVLVRLTYRVLSTSMYLAILAILDTLMIYNRCVAIWVHQLVDIDITRMIANRSNAACQVYSFVTHFIIHLDAWLLTAAVLECTIVITKPLKAHHLCSTNRVRNILLVEILLLVCINAHFFWTYGLEPDYMDNTKFFCTFSTFGNHYSEYFRHIVWPVMDLLSSAVAPGCIILFSCIHALRHRCKERPLAQADNADDRVCYGSIIDNPYLLDPEATNRFVLICIALGLMSVAFTLPQTTYLTFEYVLERANLYQHFLNNSVNFTALKKLGQVVCESMKDIFLSLKFVFYIASWPTFRRELSKICQKRKKHIRSKTGQKCLGVREDTELCLTESVST